MEDDDYEIESLENDPMMAMMPMSFGKQDRKRDLTAGFAKTKRVVNAGNSRPELQQEKEQPEVAINPVWSESNDDEEDESDDDMIGPMPAEAEVQDEEEGADNEDEFPISHEIILADHAKVFHSSLT